MPAGQNTAHFFRIIYIILFVFSSLLVLFSIDPSMFDFTQVFNFLEYLMLFVQILIQTLATLAISLTRMITDLKAGIFLIGDPNYSSLNWTSISTAITSITDPLNNFFPHSNITDLSTLIEDFSHFFGATAILILLPIAILSGIGFLREGDTKLAIYSFLGYQLIIIIAIFTQKILISTEINTGLGFPAGLIDMVFSPIFTLGFLLYLLLEVAFQTSYTLNILEPMTEREKRIQEHLKRIRAFVPKTTEGGERDEHSVQSVQSKKFGLLAASYLREMVERRVFKRGDAIRDDKAMMRLQSYLASLNQSDAQTDQKLAARTARAEVTLSGLMLQFAVPMFLRIVVVIVLSYFIMAPEGLLNLFVAASFPALLQSLELTQPEFRTIAILNVAFLFILFSVILHYLTSGRTGKVFVRVVQQIDTLVDFDRGSKPQVASETVEEEIAEETPSDQEEEIS